MIDWTANGSWLVDVLFLSMSHQTFAISNRAYFKSEKIWTRVLYVGPSMDLKSLAALSKIKKIPETMSTRDKVRSFNAKEIFHL